ncbi:MAG: tRNA (adenosine(37)-N6)-threonylcarbamoyltransferase complex dimerization subunit type 1 TsaB [Negativicutes bacterium]|nr:tRNA (adenosine(37)-N6)-threonylcarbamoyltransferase complex dimerization subunit type 1 TsaB [Negativicutes bacterium]
MLLIAIDAATRYSGLALLQDETVLAECIISSGKTHSQRLLPALDFLLREAGYAITQIEAIVVTEGPGSFTGLRIGMSTAKGLAQGLNCPLVGVSTLEAWAAGFAGGNGLILPLLDARRGEFYTALYRRRDQQLETLIEPCQRKLTELAAMIQPYPELVWPIGDAMETYREAVLQVLGDRSRLAPDCQRLPRPAMLGTLGYHKLQKGQNTSLFALRLQYLRQSEAEVKRLARLAKE